MPTVHCWLSPLSGVLYLSGWAELMRLSTFRQLKPRVQANTDQFSCSLDLSGDRPRCLILPLYASETGATGQFFCYLLNFVSVFSFKPEFLSLLPWFVTFLCLLCHCPLSANNFPLFIYCLRLRLFIDRFRTACTLYSRSDQWFSQARHIAHMGNMLSLYIAFIFMFVFVFFYCWCRLYFSKYTKILQFI